jgi:N6-adenosine-specific RNA methylase IME4
VSSRFPTIVADPPWRYRKTPGENGKFAPGAAENHFQAPRTAHSAKPDCFYDMVERVTPGPHVEMFARRARFGWAYWGNESLGTASMVAT